MNTFIQFFFNFPLLPTITRLGSKHGCDYRIGLKNRIQPIIGKAARKLWLTSVLLTSQTIPYWPPSKCHNRRVHCIYEDVGWNIVLLNHLDHSGKRHGILAVGFNEFGDDQALAYDPMWGFDGRVVQNTQDWTLSIRIQTNLYPSIIQLLLAIYTKGERSLYK